ncbi:hypothetical protein [Actinomadura rubrisoli]|uniref:Uncharacterized protein n=1 Tax=Actinomadura rubrisoli TaxID=2530368 RepID=A0A4R5A4E1_9ACTN|nr:hypothetical protein [Actinomadura rubrisoli]TDD66783.1 hypothetical protein E1298_39975 [Actinomadura rubrisoli]
MKRRQVVQLLATLGISAVGTPHEPVRQLLAQSLESGYRDLNAWHLTISDHLHALRTRPPTTVREGLAVDLFAVKRQQETASVPETTELHRVIAALAMIQANASTRLGQHGTSIH